MERMRTEDDSGTQDDGNGGSSAAMDFRMGGMDGRASKEPQHVKRVACTQCRQSKVSSRESPLRLWAINGRFALLGGADIVVDSCAATPPTTHVRDVNDLA
jgi:hypothetical protein